MKKGVKNAGAEELVVVARAYDLMREMTARTRKFPRDLRFVLGDRILTTTCDVFDTLLEAKYSRVKRQLLQRANLLLERLRYQTRLCHEEKLISAAQFEYLAGRINEIGSMVGGWAKSVQE